MIEESLRCRICTSENLKTKPFGYQFKGRWLKGVECENCDVIFIHPQPPSEDLKDMYSKNYFENDFRCGHAGSYFDDNAVERLVDHSLLQKIMKYQPGGKFLEVGCAGGAFLNAARELGYEVTGVEFSEDAAFYAHRKFGLNVLTGDLLTTNLPRSCFDVVFLGDVLEHLPNPVAALMEIRRIMSPLGLLVIECPTQTNTLFSRLGFLVYSILGKRAVVQLPPYHLFEYRPKSLTNLLHQCGFKIIHRVPTAMPPNDLVLRGSMLQRVGKKIFQYPNGIVTRVLGLFGDRIEIIATPSNAFARGRHG